MRRLSTLLILLLAFPLIALCQSKQNTVYTIANNIFLKNITEELSQFKNGSGFTLIYFELNPNSFRRFKSASSNSLSKKIVDSMMEKHEFFFEVNKLKKGNFILPIIQIMLDEDTKNSSDLNWENNSSWQLRSFDKFPSYKKIIFLKPIIIYGYRPIQ
ncbi:MAG: hypothetical protein JSR09_07590 [Bacteroidetes bacterium]|nr:hypothetical protein [Bacteroidota bacterium]MBS1639368.1 hypothetical protein [Bacteroidota bacterium]MBS1642890.1 hypothetical protein [Bacteroidota bacterium]MBS1649555.1 hypothetical protein [Bacteroidota bacterium]MBS1670377.1 hypothetical protein [Bacteroidota bacterium]